MAALTLRDGAQESAMAAPVDAEESGPLTLVPGRRQRLGEQLYGQILEQIYSGRLQAGDRLPPEQNISRMFGVSRPVVRQALMRLREDGLLEARQGAGTFVKSHVAAPVGPGTGHGDMPAYLHAMEARLGLEVTIARLAAERAAPAQLDIITKAQARFREACETRTDCAAADTALHMALAEASNNPLLPTLLRAALDMVETFLDAAGNTEALWVAAAEHDAILAAIHGQDIEAAEAAMKFHLTQSRRRLQAHMAPANLDAAP